MIKSKEIAVNKKSNKDIHALKVEYKKTAELIPYVNNARTHSEEQIKQVAASIKEFGFTNPILIDENNGIIAGHGRSLAAELLKMEQVPTITLTGLTDNQRKAYIFADNKLALNAGWDIDLVKMELEGLKDVDYDINLIGFDEKELSEFFDEYVASDINDKPMDKEEFLVVIECSDEQQQSDVFEVVEDKGWSCKLMN